MNRSFSLKASLFDSLLLTYILVAPVLFFISSNNESAQIQALGFWPWAVLVFLISLIGSFFIQRFGGRTLGALIYSRQQFRLSGIWSLYLWAWQAGSFFAITLILGLIATRFSLYELFDQEGFRGAMRLFAGLLHPNLSVLPRAIIHIVETVFIAFLATFLALPLSFALSFLGAKNLFKSASGRSIYIVIRVFLNIVRSIEALIWAIIFSVWVGIGPFAGMLALMVHSIASLTKQFSEIIEGVERGPIEGIESTGAHPIQIVWFGIVPQVILPFVSFSIYRWDINVRMATVIGLVGGGGIGTMLIQYQGQAMWSEVGCIVFAIVFVVWMMDSISAQIREALK